MAYVWMFLLLILELHPPMKKDSELSTPMAVKCDLLVSRHLADYGAGVVCVWSHSTYICYWGGKSICVSVTYLGHPSTIEDRIRVTWDYAAIQGPDGDALSSAGRD